MSLIIIVAAPRWPFSTGFDMLEAFRVAAKAVVAVLVMAGAVLWKVCGRRLAFRLILEMRWRGFSRDKDELLHKEPPHSADLADFACIVFSRINLRMFNLR